jgi:hypothetical protein
VVALGRRRALDAGDTLLGVLGVWLLLVQGAKLAVLHGDAPAPLFLGMTAAVVAIGVATSRAVYRRAWCRRIARGEIHGYRLREGTSVELAQLAQLYEDGFATNVVLETLGVGPTAYRDQPLSVPHALVPRSADVRAH